MIAFIKRLFCKHDKLFFIRNVYGDEIIDLGYSRSVWKCEKCGKIIYKGELA